MNPFSSNEISCTSTLSSAAIPANRYPKAILKARPLHVVTMYVGRGPSICSTIILSREGTWNVIAVCSSKNSDRALATGLLSPMASVSSFLESSSKRCLTDTCPRSDKTSWLSSKVLLLASPVQEGIVGLYPVADETFTLVPITLETLYVDPPSRNTSPFLRLETNDDDSCPTRVPSEVKTR